MNLKRSFGALKRFKSSIILSVVIIAIIIPVVISTVNASKYPILFSVGSSAVKPILNAFANKYTNKVDSKFDLIIDAGGSSTGIESIAYGYTQIGNTSRKPHADEVSKDGGRFHKEWVDNQLKTLTLAWDGIAIVYKQPKNATKTLNINDDNINKLYEAMTGIYDGKNMTLNDICSGSGDVEIKAYPRSGGSSKSGTADAFANDSHLKVTINNDVKNALKTGQYNFNRNNINVTNESNSETWLRVLNDNKEGAITYLSTGFVLNNEKEILDNGFKIATYNNGIPMTFEKISNGYNWVRPINTIISLRDKSIAPFKTFVEWLYESETSLTKTNQKLLSIDDFKKIGVVPLKKEQILAMCDKKGKSSNLWVSDANLGFSFGASLEGSEND